MGFRGLLRRRPNSPGSPPPKRGILSRLGLKELCPDGRNIAHPELYVQVPSRRGRL